MANVLQKEFETHQAEEVEHSGKPDMKHGRGFFLGDSALSSLEKLSRFVVGETCRGLDVEADLIGTEVRTFVKACPSHFTPDRDKPGVGEAQFGLTFVLDDDRCPDRVEHARILQGMRVLVDQRGYRDQAVIQPHAGCDQVLEMAERDGLNTLSGREPPDDVRDLTQRKVAFLLKIANCQDGTDVALAIFGIGPVLTERFRQDPISKINADGFPTHSGPFLELAHLHSKTIVRRKPVRQLSVSVSGNS